MSLAPSPLLVCSLALLMSQIYSVSIETKYRLLSSKFEKFYVQNEGFFKLNPMDSLRSLYQLFAIRYSLFMYSRIVNKYYSCKNSWMVIFASIRLVLYILDRSCLMPSHITIIIKLNSISSLAKFRVHQSQSLFPTPNNL